MATHRYPITYTGKTIVDWNTLNVNPYKKSEIKDLVDLAGHLVLQK